MEWGRFSNPQTVRWTKADAKRAWIAAEGGALEVTLGRVDPDSIAQRLQLLHDKPDALAMHNLWGMVSLYEERAARNAAFVVWLASPENKAYPKPETQAELKERFDQLAHDDEAGAKMARRLIEKIKLHGMPPKA